jgi:hypothetical protein
MPETHEKSTLSHQTNAWAPYKVYTLPSHKMPETHEKSTLSHHTKCLRPMKILHYLITQNAWAPHEFYALPSHKMPELHTKSTLSHHTKCLSPTNTKSTLSLHTKCLSPTQSTRSHHIPLKCISISSPSTPRSFKMSPHQNPVHIPLLHTCHTPYQSHPSTFESPDLKIHSLSITNHKAAHYAVFSSLLSLPPS